MAIGMAASAIGKVAARRNRPQQVNPANRAASGRRRGPTRVITPQTRPQPTPGVALPTRPQPTPGVVAKSRPTRAAVTPSTKRKPTSGVATPGSIGLGTTSNIGVGTTPGSIGLGTTPNIGLGTSTNTGTLKPKTRSAPKYDMGAWKNSKRQMLG